MTIREGHQRLDRDERSRQPAGHQSLASLLVVVTRAPIPLSGSAALSP